MPPVPMPPVPRPPANERKPSPKSAAARRAPVLIVSVFAVALLILGGVIWLVTTPPDAASGVGGPFTLTDGAGKTVTDKDFRGKYMLIYFGYTFCPDVCPTTLQHVTDAMNVLGTKGDQVQPIFITVDPKRDTPPVVGSYVAAFTPKLVGLTGTSTQIGAVEQAYHVYAAIHPPEDGKGDYSVDHSSVIYLVGPDGRFLAPIPADDSGKEIAGEIVQHMAG